MGLTREISGEPFSGLVVPQVGRRRRGLPPKGGSIGVFVLPGRRCEEAQIRNGARGANSRWPTRRYFQAPPPPPRLADEELPNAVGFSPPPTRPTSSSARRARSMARRTRRRKAAVLAANKKNIAQLSATTVSAPPPLPANHPSPLNPPFRHCSVALAFLFIFFPLFSNP